MTRRSQITRSTSYAGPSELRQLGGGSIIWCADYPCAFGEGVALSIPIVASPPYQRFYVSATLDGVVAWNFERGGGVGAVVEIGSERGIGRVWINVPPLAPLPDEWDWGTSTNLPVSLTGVIDFEAGAHQIQLRVFPQNHEFFVHADRANMQVIQGQILETPGCAQQGSCGGG
jgi:hypothetical protein